MLLELLVSTISSWSSFAAVHDAASVASPTAGLALCWQALLLGCVDVLDLVEKLVVLRTILVLLLLVLLRALAGSLVL